MTEQLYRVYEQPEEDGGRYFTGLTLDEAQELFDNMFEAGYDPLIVPLRNPDYYEEDNK